MTKRNDWTLDFNARSLQAATPAEQAFLRDAERIALEVADMSEEEVADYLVENNLQDLVTPERVDALLAKAMDHVRNRCPKGAPRALTAKDILGETQLAQGNNVITPHFGKRGGESDDQTH